MEMIAQFTTDNVSTTGLSPTVTIVDVADGTVIVNTQAMAAITNAAGWYKYDFATFDATKDYIATADAGVDTVDDRYPASAVGNDDIAEAVMRYERV